MTELIIISIGLNFALLVSLMILYNKKVKEYNNYIENFIILKKEIKQVRKDNDLLAEIIVDGQDVHREIVDASYNDYEYLENVIDTLNRNYKNYKDTINYEYIKKEIDRLIEQEKEQRKEDE